MTGYDVTRHYQFVFLASFAKNSSSLHDLAKSLRVTEETVRAKIEYLERMGYLRNVSFSSCEVKACTGCPDCPKLIHPPTMWELK
jgi:predicted ArsR family transcriptional regulator